MAIKKIPCGGFRYDDETVEFNNGIMKAKGASKEVTNAIETHGMGWTEQGEQTVITWDGDTEGRDVLSVSVRDMTFNYCKAAEKGTGYTDTAKYTESTSASEWDVDLLRGDGAIAYVTDVPVVIIADGGEFNLPGFFGGTAPSSGVYFIYVDDEDNTLTLTYGISDTIHQIDQKYIPQSSGGGMVIHFEIDENHNLIYDHTVEEVKDALKTMPVSACLIYNGEIVIPYYAMCTVLRHPDLPDDTIVFYMMNFTNEPPAVNIQVYEKSDGTWSNEFPINY